MSPGGQHLDGHTALVHLGLVEFVEQGGLGRHQGGVERLVFLFVQRAVDIVPRALRPVLPPVAGGAESVAHIHALSGDNGGGGIVKAQGTAAAAGDGTGQGFGSQGPGGNHRHPGFRQLGQLTVLHRDERMGPDLLRHQGGEAVPVYRQGPSGRHRALMGRRHAGRAETGHLLLEQPGRAGEPGGLEGIGTDQLGESRAVVGGGVFIRLHLDQPDRYPGIGGGKGRLASG